MKPRSSRALRNLGTIIRTADWFGVRRIVCSNGTVSCFNPKVEQSTMGSLFRTEVLYADAPRRPCLRSPVAPYSWWATRAVASPRRSGSASPTPSLFPNLGGTAESLNGVVACAIFMAQMLQKP